MTDLHLPPALSDAFSDGADGCGLRIGRCPRTGRVFFPAPLYCPCCLAPPQRAVISGRGTVHAFTVVRTKAPFGLPEPYAVGYVDLLAADLRVFGLFAPESLPSLRPGVAADLTVRPLGRDAAGRPCLRPVYMVES